MGSDSFKKFARSLKGELRTDFYSREIFASAACLYRIQPQAVAFPKEDNDAIRIVEFASQKKIPITPRGAGSAVAGQTLGSGVVVNFIRHFNRILEIKPEEKKVLVEPGVIYADLNRELARFGLFFPPDPSSGDYCTIGGMIANNSSGAHSLFYGSTQSYVEELEVVLADGSKARVGENFFEIIEQGSDWAKKIAFELQELFKIHQREIDADRPQVKNASGYLVWNVISETGINFARLLVGSEGTLALILRAWLKLMPVPKFKSVGLVFFRDLNLAALATQILREQNPLAIEIMDRNFIHLVWQNYPDLRPLLDEEAEDMLLVEFSGETESEAQEKLKTAFEELIGKDQLGYKSIIAQDKKEAEQLWKVRKSASPILYRLGSGLVRFIEDIVIPPEKLPEGVEKIQRFFQEMKTFAPILGHAGEGNLHLNPKFNPMDKEDQRRMQILADRVYKMVIQLGGSITGEHGDGILRAPYVNTQFPNAFPVFQELKKIFDPEEIFNPGKILAEPGMIPLEHIKYWIADSQTLQAQSNIYALSSQQDMDLLFRCHGCGLCRTYCPAYLGTGTELALPRSKVSIARALAQGAGAEEILKSQDLRTLLNYCYSCQRCLRLCPTGVSVPRILDPIRNFQRQKEIFSLRSMVLERGGDLLNLMTKTPSPIVRLSSSKPSRGALRIIGINPEAKGLVSAKDHNKIRKSKSLMKLKPSPRKADLKIIYFPGCLESALEPEEFENTLKILVALEAEIVILDNLCCGIPAISQGNPKLAKKQAQKLADKILPLLEQGYQILSNCPSCVFTFIEHYPLWLGAKAEQISKNTITFYSLLPKIKARIKKSGHRKKFVYHRACHLIGLGEPDPALALLRELNLSPEAVIEQCCGAGGAFEMKIENAEVSAKIAEILKAELSRISAKTVVSACGLCRRKIESLGFETKSPLDIISELIE